MGFCRLLKLDLLLSFRFGGGFGVCHAFRLRELKNWFKPKFLLTFVIGKVTRFNKLRVTLWNNIANKVTCSHSIGVSVLILLLLSLLWNWWKNLVWIAFGVNCVMMFGVDKNVLFHGMDLFTRVSFTYLSSYSTRWSLGPFRYDALRATSAFYHVESNLPPSCPPAETVIFMDDRSIISRDVEGLISRFDVWINWSNSAGLVEKQRGPCMVYSAVFSFIWHLYPGYV